MESTKSWRKLVLPIIIIMSMTMSSCAKLEALIMGPNKKEDISIFKGTEAWKLAVAVSRQNVRNIEKIAAQNPELLDFQDPYFRATLLIWAVGMEKYRSAEALLRSGADPNIVADGTEIFEAMIQDALARDDLGFFSYGTPPKPLMGETALFIASGYSWIDRQAKKDPKFVNLLLEYGADPNICFTNGTNYVITSTGNRYWYGIEAGTSPLMNSIGCGIEKTKALVEAGADIDNQTESGRTAAIRALLSSVGRNSEYAHYLIVEKKANVTEPFFRDLLAIVGGG